MSTAGAELVEMPVLPQRTRFQTGSIANTKAQSLARPALAQSRVSSLLYEGRGFFIPIGVAVFFLQFALGLIPKLLLATFGATGQLPELVGALADFLLGWIGHVFPRA